MFELAFVVLLAAPEFVQQHSAEIKSALPSLKGKYRGTWAITGKHVRNVLGEPSHVHNITLQSGGIWHICRCDYQHVGLRIHLYAQNQINWELPVGSLPVKESIPENYELSNAQFLDVPTTQKENSPRKLTADR